MLRRVLEPTLLILLLWSIALLLPVLLAPGHDVAEPRPSAGENLNEGLLERAAFDAVPAGGKTPSVPADELDHLEPELPDEVAASTLEPEPPGLGVVTIADEIGQLHALDRLEAERDCLRAGVVLAGRKGGGLPANRVELLCERGHLGGWLCNSDTGTRDWFAAADFRSREALLSALLAGLACQKRRQHHGDPAQFGFPDHASRQAHGLTAVNRGSR
jgi:hypothetical protein